MTIDVRHLAALKAVAKHRSFSRAGASLGYSQSSISHQIAAFERVVGQKLVDRGRNGGGVQLTPAGEAVMQHVEAILAQLSAARHDLNALAEPRSHELRIGVTQSIGVRVLPELLRRFAADRPGLRLRPTEFPGDVALYLAIERDEIELAFVELPPPAGPFELFELLVDPYVLLVPRDSPLANGDLKVQQLADTPLISPSCRRVLELVEADLRASGIEPRVGIRSDVNALIQPLVAAGLGVAILPALATDSTDPLTTPCELPGIPPRVVALARHRHRHHTDAERAFLRVAQAVCREFSREDKRSLGGNSAQPPRRAVHSAEASR